ncbi:MAG: Disease resistance protein [Rhodospirillales bacterium]|nr:Disease resistance protein [Rhodospirillales bacterium]
MAHAAENLLLRSLDLARRHEALSWELRTATSLAMLWRDGGRIAQAADLLGAVYGRFQEGLGTADLIRAARLLEELGA